MSIQIGGIRVFLHIFQIFRAIADGDKMIKFPPDKISLELVVLSLSRAKMRIGSKIFSFWEKLIKTDGIHKTPDNMLFRIRNDYLIMYGCVDRRNDFMETIIW